MQRQQVIITIENSTVESAKIYLVCNHVISNDLNEKEKLKCLKVAVSAFGLSPDAFVDPCFGQCTYFVIADVDVVQFEAILNSAQLLAE